MKIYNFWGDLTDISAKKEALECIHCSESFPGHKQQDDNDAVRRTNKLQHAPGTPL